MSTTYYVEVLGRLWMPSCHAATNLTITDADLMNAGFDNPDDLDAEDIAEYVDTHGTGDFSSITALAIVRVEKVTEDPVSLPDGWTKRATVTRESVLSSFTDEQEMAFADCFAEYEEDEPEEVQVPEEYCDYCETEGHTFGTCEKRDDYNHDEVTL